MAIAQTTAFTVFLKSRLQKVYLNTSSGAKEYHVEEENFPAQNSLLTDKTSLKEDEIKSAMGLIAGSTQVLLVPFFP